MLSIKILRYDEIKVRYCNQHGKIIKKKLTGFLSKLFQHELEHLEGKLMLESSKKLDWAIMSNEKKDHSKYMKLIEEYFKKYLR